LWRKLADMQSLWILVAALLFSVMSVLVKLASEAHSVWEIIFWRNAVGLLFLLQLLRSLSGGIRANLSTPHWPAHLVRNLTGVMSVVLWFSSIPHLPLTTSMTLNYTSSLFIGLIVFIGAAWQGKHMKNIPMLFALVLGFAGILLVLRPTIGPEQIVWAVIGLLGGAMGGVAMMSVRALGQLGEPSSRTVFYFSLGGFLVGLLGVLLFGFKLPTLEHTLYLLGAGLTSVLAQLALTRAYGQGRALLTANLNYSGILFASFWGWLIWHDILPLIAWLGIALIIIAGILATWLTAYEAKPSHGGD
jgi:S-adenosylmethionine uptake transporter